MPDGQTDPLDTFGAALRRGRAVTSTSLSALGALVHYSKGHLSKIENAAAPANLGLARACDMALGTGGRLTAAFLAESSRPSRTADSAKPETRFDIPPAPSYFTGRVEAAARVIEAVLGAASPGRAPTVLIYGMPGIGKTALAIHAAHTLRPRYPGGCLFVDFGGRPFPDPAERVHALLRRLGIAADAIPDDPGEARALYLSIVCHRPVLVVADGVTSAAQSRRWCRRHPLVA